jgi:pSer/pThr/pTyr-binding forkhead associated (FHA) protein
MPWPVPSMALSRTSSSYSDYFFRRAPVFQRHAVKLRLVRRDPSAVQQEIVVEHFPVELGRGNEAAVQIDDRWLSRKHCRLVLADGALYVHDLSSRHGTLVNGQPIRECQLLPGDELCIGLTHFIAEYEPELALQARS